MLFSVGITDGFVKLSAVVTGQLIILRSNFNVCKFSLRLLFFTSQCVGSFLGSHCNV